jgi:hypothetical protein
MTKYEIIDEIANAQVVEKIVYKLLPASKNRFDCPADLIQDIYILLLAKDDNLIGDLYQKKELGYYILRIAKNQLLSCNSPYFYMYVKFGVHSDGLEKVKDFIYE